jgi:GTPase
VAVWHRCNSGHRPPPAAAESLLFPFRAPASRRSSDIRPLIEVHPPVERAFLVGAPRKGTDDAAQVEEHLDELARLADTAGAGVVGRAVQRIEAPTPNFYLGQGKVDELKAVLQSAGATLVLVDEPLSPVQGANLEKALGVRVMDRTEVILDIFATRARSHEAKMQVELAQLEYLLPRLTRLWTHLSRIRGGIGLRGPGETQLETDRRVIRRKIGVLRRRLEGVADHRANQRLGRRMLPSAALVGYTNAGKSSLLSALSGDALFVEDRLFATLDTVTREVDVGGGYRVRLTDTVGFIRKLPHHLVASFRASLEEASEADLLLHVIDASHPGWEEQAEVVERVLGEMGLNNSNTGGRGRGEEGGVSPERKRVVYVFNKADLLVDPEAFIVRVRERFPHAVLASAAPDRSGPSLSGVDRRGVDELRGALRSSAQALRPVALVRVPLGDGKLLAVLHRDAEVMGQEQVDGAVIVTARVEASLLGRLRREGIGVEILG